MGGGGPEGLEGEAVDVDFGMTGVLPVSPVVDGW